MSLILRTLAWSMLAVAAASAEEVSAVDIVRNPTPYRNRIITVRGTMLNPRPATIGTLGVPPATVFELSAGPALLQVLTTVPPACQVPSTVTVEGRLVAREQVGQNVYANVIRAITVSCR